MSLPLFPDEPPSFAPAEDVDVRQTGRTPRLLGRNLCEEFHLELDVAADAENALLPNFLTLEDDALNVRWAPFRCWMNPPFGAMDVWLTKTLHEVQLGATVVMIAPATPGVAWWLRACRAGLWWLFDARVEYEAPPGVKYSKPGFGSALWLFSPGVSGSFGGFRDRITGSVLP